MEKVDKPKGGNITGMDCNCLPSCSTTIYKLDSNIGEMITDDGLSDDEKPSIVYVYFKDLTCLKYRRDPFMNWDGLFGNFYFFYIVFYVSDI